ncbi:MAG: branched-chain amino acid ABC transporter permease [Hyphomicrobiales bacterium]
MSFDVVASSRIEREKISPWRSVLYTGGQFGLLAVSLALVGILSMFNQRPIIVGVMSLGYATLIAVFMLAGVVVARRRLFGAAAGEVIGGAAAGGIAGAMLTVVAACTWTWPWLRQIFVVLEPLLLKFLTFYNASPVTGMGLMILFSIAMGALGALLVVMPRPISRPLVAGLIGAGLAGLFQELIRPILANSAYTKPLHDQIYTYTGLKLQGAIIIFILCAIGSVLRMAYGKQASQAFHALPAETQKNIRWTAFAILGLIAVLFPAFAGNFIGQVLLLVALFTLMGMGLNIEVGLAGLLDLGFVAFYAVGAYTTALLTADSDFALAHLAWWEAMPIAVLMSVFVGILFGVPVLKVRGDYLAVATMGLGEIVRVIVLSDAAAPLLAGAKGILHIPRPMFFGYELNTPVALFYLALTGTAIAAFIAWRLEDSRLGRAWMAIRDDEDVAQALGINLINVKLLAYGLGAAFAGLAGSIFATMLGSIYPASFQLIISINVLALIIVGGMGSLPGVALGALVLIGLPEMLREFGEFRYLFYGIAIVAVMRLKPEGLWPSAARRREARSEQELAAEREAALIAEKA